MSSESSNGGIGFVGLLQVAFIVMKVAKVIDWSWWWVMSPMIGSAAFGLTALLIAGLFLLFATMASPSPSKRVR